MPKSEFITSKAISPFLYLQFFNFLSLLSTREPQDFCIEALNAPLVVSDGRC